jgi:hypothetical protein
LDGADIEKYSGYHADELDMQKLSRFAYGDMQKLSAYPPQLG